MRFLFFEKKPQFDQHYVPEKGMTGESRLRASLSGLSWDQVAIPPRRHRCWPQTISTSRGQALSFRCACGGWSINGKTWIDKNMRRKAKRCDR